MFNIYDNGDLLLGKVKDIKTYQTALINEDLIDKEDYEEISEYLESLKDNDIICINYASGMGLSFDIWNESDKVEV